MRLVGSRIFVLIQVAAAADDATAAAAEIREQLTVQSKRRTSRQTATYRQTENQAGKDRHIGRRTARGKKSIRDIQAERSNHQEKEKGRVCGYLK